MEAVEIGGTTSIEVQPREGQSPPTVTAPSCACNGGTATPQYVYAFGRVRCVAPLTGVERELNQALAQSSDTGHQGLDQLRATLARPENRYLVRTMCWVLVVQGVDRYQLLPRDPTDFELLVHAIREPGWPATTDLVIGVMGPPTGQGPCGSLPTVWFNQLSSVNVPEFLQRIPRPAPESKAEGEHFVRTGHALLSRIVEEAANDGSQAIHRAKNYVAMRYPGIYAKTADATRQNTALTNVLGQLSPLGNGRLIVDIILEHTNRQTDVAERHFVRVDVTEELPFLVSQHLQPYYE